ncbi:MAG: acetate/propionate family kinase [Betaproteobacteria bacterium]|nr:acetate/propionate family kinase [Betaproteobacteria bacterium]
MSDQILVLNSGSSSVKFALFTASAEPDRGLHGDISGLGASPAVRAWDGNGNELPVQFAADGAHPLDHPAALRWLLEWLNLDERGAHLIGAGHRVVHGGARHAAPVRVGPGVLDELERLTPLASLHQPHNLAAIRALGQALPRLPQVACFDTAFHRTQAAAAQGFALPREITAAGVRRYGFHGLSYEHIASVLPRHLGKRAEGRVIVAHLGSGASLCALKNCVSVATTMGFTTLDGLMMGTRCGAIDPGVLLYFMRERGMSAAEIEDLLSRRSGLLGVSGLSGDVRELLASDDPRAREALEMFAYRAARELGSLAAALEGLDALVFTAGVGEHAAPIRAMICEYARWLGVELDGKANSHNERIISQTGSRVTVCVIPTDEEAVIARHTYRLLGVGGA